MDVKVVGVGAGSAGVDAGSVGVIGPGICNVELGAGDTIRVGRDVGMGRAQAERIATARPSVTHGRQTCLISEPPDERRRSRTQTANMLYGSETEE